MPISAWGQQSFHSNLEVESKHSLQSATEDQCFPARQTCRGVCHASGVTGKHTHTVARRLSDKASLSVSVGNKVLICPHFHYRQVCRSTSGLFAEKGGWCMLMKKRDRPSQPVFSGRESTLYTHMWRRSSPCFSPTHTHKELCLLSPASIKWF